MTESTDFRRRKGDGGEQCQECGNSMPVCWHAPQPLWDEMQHTQSGTMCPACFDKKASAAGYFLSWTPMAIGANHEGWGNSNHWHNETRDWLMMGQPFPDYVERSEHPIWALIRDTLEANGYPQPPMVYYPRGNFKHSRSEKKAGYHHMDKLAHEKYDTTEELAAYRAWRKNEFKPWVRENKKRNKNAAGR